MEHSNNKEHIEIMYCSCGFTEYVSYCIINGIKVYRWTCPNCNSIHNSTKDGEVSK